MFLNDLDTNHPLYLDEGNQKRMDDENQRKFLQNQADKVIDYKGNFQDLLPTNTAKDISGARLILFAAFSPAYVELDSSPFDSLKKIFCEELDSASDDETRTALGYLFDRSQDVNKWTQEQEGLVLKSVKEASIAQLLILERSPLQMALENGSFDLFKKILSNLIARGAAEIFLIGTATSKDCLTIELEGEMLAAKSIMRDLFLGHRQKNELIHNGEIETCTFYDIAKLIMRERSVRDAISHAIDPSEVFNRYGTPEQSWAAVLSSLEKGTCSYTAPEWQTVKDNISVLAKDSLKKPLLEEKKNYTKHYGDYAESKLTLVRASPIHLAAWSRNAEVLCALLEAKVDPNTKIQIRNLRKNLAANTSSEKVTINTLRDIIIEKQFAEEDKTRIEQSLALNQVRRYIDERNGLGRYKRNLGIFNTFMFNKEEKVNAAMALENFLMDPYQPIPRKHKGALSQGKLGKIVASITNHYKELTYEDKPKPSHNKK